MLVNGEWVPAAPTSSGSVMKPVTEAQAKDGFNAKRMAGAADTLRSLEGGGYDAGLARPVGMLPNKEIRSYNAAQAEWADSILRMTTGAAATKDEVAQMGKAYFPQFGDPPEVRTQKAAARARVEADALARAGPAARRPDAAAYVGGSAGAGVSSVSSGGVAPAASASEWKVIR